MSGSRSGARRVAGLAGLVAVGVGAWWLLGDAHERDAAVMPQTATEAQPAQPAPPAAVPADAAHAGPRIASGGRLQLDAEALPEDAPLSLTLELEDAARGAGPHGVRVISEDGRRRLDLEATPPAEGGSGLRLEIDPAFLSRGRYLIEIDTEEKRPLQIRRYVLEIR